MFKALFDQAKNRKRQALEATVAQKQKAEAAAAKDAKSKSKPSKESSKTTEKPQKKEVAEKSSSKRKRDQTEEEEVVPEPGPSKKKAKVKETVEKEIFDEDYSGEGSGDEEDGEDDSDVASAIEFDDDGVAENEDLRSALKSFIDSGGLGISSDEEEDNGDDDDNNNEETAADDNNESNANDKDSKDRSKTVFVSNLPTDTTQNQLRQHFETHCGKTVSVQVLPAKPGKTSTLAFVEFRTRACVDKALQLDGSQFKGRRLLCSLARNKEEGAVADKKAASGEFSVFVRNLALTTTTDSLRKAFEKCGKIVSVRIPVDTLSGKARGYGFVDFEDEKSLESALKLSKTKLDGRAISVEHAGSGKKK